MSSRRCLFGPRARTYFCRRACAARPFRSSSNDGRITDRPHCATGLVVLVWICTPLFDPNLIGGSTVLGKGQHYQKFTDDRVHKPVFEREFGRAVRSRRRLHRGIAAACWRMGNEMGSQEKTSPPRMRGRGAKSVGRNAVSRPVRPAPCQAGTVCQAALDFATWVAMASINAGDRQS